jgi:glycosyltransferase involved in cell wall biosynthesis
MQPKKILLSAYACEPGRGSEPGVGWNFARELARHQEVWVITRARNRPAIEAELDGSSCRTLHFVYHDLGLWPHDLTFEKHKAAMELHYYLWQFGAYDLARRLHSEIGFDVAQHVTFVRYWMPSLFSLLPIPFVWGPVGGGESMPGTFHRSLNQNARLFEYSRSMFRWLGEHDPLVRMTARRCAVALATTRETADRLERIGVQHVELMSELALAQTDLKRLGQMSWLQNEPVRFVSIGRLLHWKGFHLGLQAFAEAGIDGSEYWIIGNGPEEERLRALARELGVQRSVKFWGRLTRGETLQKLGQSRALVHPSLHDSGGWVCVEAMAARRPVICLDIGGPSYQVSHEVGYKIPAHSPKQCIEGLAAAMRAVADDQEKNKKLGETGYRRVAELFTWNKKIQMMLDVYTKVLQQDV